MPLVARWPTWRRRPNISASAAMHSHSISTKHRRQVADHGGRVRRLDHLPGVPRMKEQVIVLQPLGEPSELLGERVAIDRVHGSASGATTTSVGVVLSSGGA
ncbi:hypothetical protein AB0L88_44900 [Saccharopolyspora shandongensis]|uniref:hypothetical protein n=1 Tax=Saccharopolyspora shandongensis TaxID=418495 RepID=UPI0015A51E74|nr:hypothetical protein [Saccharopolyspora shandongensis]